MSQLWNDVLVAVKRKRHGNAHTIMTRTASAPGPSDPDSTRARRMVEAQDSVIADRLPGGPVIFPDALDKPSAAPLTFKDSEDYDKQRKEVMRRERALGFDHACAMGASKEEIRADAILQRLKRKDVEKVYDKADERIGYAGQEHKRRSGDHFLSNVELIEKTAVFNVAQHMPKGAHLHIHFNACLQPEVLLEVAATMDRMFIWSNLPLTPDNKYTNYEKCEIQFSILAPGKERPGNLFHPSYVKEQTMPFRAFLGTFPGDHPYSANEWLRRKLLFNEDDAHDKLQTSYGAWEKFNGRTRMMKGLFNYESAYRIYTRKLLKDFLRDNIQYAEIRPNFMKSNQLRTDDGLGELDNVEIMKIIIEEYNEFQKAQRKKGGGYFAGLKVIYCTPRSFEPEKVEFALKQCLEFKQKWPKWIAGFDLVGEEAAGKPLSHFIPQFLAFRKACAVAHVDIPFLFHCGETLEVGTSTDGNVVDALLLGSARIGHGFALPRHPYVMEQMKSRGVCVELCPVSNEVLGLTPRVGGHALYELLANNVHCTVSSDNGTFFRTTLSHDFYQVMIGKDDMTLHGWRQLVEWSLEHSRMDDAERGEAQEQWLKLWNKFLAWMIETYEKEVDV